MADGAVDKSVGLSVDRQRAAARGRLFHGSARGDARPDPHSCSHGTQARHRSSAVRSDIRVESDDRHDHAAGGGRAVRHRENRRRAVRSTGARDAALSMGTDRGARIDHGVAGGHDVSAASAARQIDANGGCHRFGLTTRERWCTLRFRYP